MQEGLQIGQIVKVRAGHDKNNFMVVVGIIDDEYILIADGKTRKIEKPKLKKLKHTARTNHIAKEIAGSILSGQAPTNAQIKSAISAFIERKDMEELVE